MAKFSNLFLAITLLGQLHLLKNHIYDTDLGGSSRGVQTSHRQKCSGSFGQENSEFR